MIRKKEDRRVIRTERQLEEALFHLLKNKSIQQITVRELSDAADITRATFYTHYRDAYDMLLHLQDEMIRHIIEIINDTTGKNPHDFFLRLFHYFAEELRHPEILFINSGEVSAMSRIGTAIRDNYMLKWTKKGGDYATTDYVYYRTYIIYGCISVLKLWIENGMLETPERMADLAVSFLPEHRMVVR